MPHLSELAAKYKDKVTFLALSDETEAVVGAFLQEPSRVAGKTWAEAMAFTVATDPDKSVKNDIFRAAGQRGIPSSFIIRAGVIEWIGHPARMDAPLKAVVEGTWDREAFKRQFVEEQAAKEAGSVVRRAMQKAARDGDWDAALAELDDAIAKYPAVTNLKMQKWTVLLTKLQRDEEAYALGRRLLKQRWNDANSLNGLAWTVVDDPGVRNRDLEFAMKAAARANELTHSKNAAILDTLARVHYEKGDLEGAIKWQRQAVERAGRERSGNQIREVLEKYEKESRAKAKATEKKGEYF